MERDLLRVDSKFLCIVAISTLLLVPFNQAAIARHSSIECSPSWRAPNLLADKGHVVPHIAEQFSTAIDSEGSDYTSREMSPSAVLSAERLSFPTETYTITNNGTHTFAYDEEGQIAFSGVDASTVINTAISSTVSRGGGKIVITPSPAAYEIKNKLKVQGNNLELKGAEGAVFMTSADIASILQVHNEAGGTIENVTITGLIFDGNNAHITDPFDGLIYVLNARNIFIDNVEVTRSGLRENYMGFLVPQPAIDARNVKGLWIGNCYVHDNMGSGIIARFWGTGSTSEVNITNNTIVRTNMSNATGGYAAIDIAASNFSIANNYVYRAPFGVQISGNTTTNGYIFGNIMIGNSGAELIAESGIEIWDEGASFIQIKSNCFRRWSYGAGAVGIGIELGNTYSPYVADGAHHNEIAYNIIDSGGYSQPLSTFGITINGKYNRVYNNTIYSPNTAGIVELGVSEFNEIHDNAILYLDERIPGDINGDGVVDIMDLYDVGNHWYHGPHVEISSYDIFADLNYDGVVDVSDLRILNDHYA